MQVRSRTGAAISIVFSVIFIWALAKVETSGKPTTFGWLAMALQLILEPECSLRWLFR